MSSEVNFSFFSFVRTKTQLAKTTRQFYIVLFLVEKEVGEVGIFY
jgi:hypothetical protein